MVFSGAGLRVARNRPYAGGFCTRSYGRPQHGVHALQVEISRHLYMNEVTLEKTAGFEAMRLSDRYERNISNLHMEIDRYLARL